MNLTPIFLSNLVTLRPHYIRTMNNQTTDNIIDRDILQHDYIRRIIDTMDYKDVERFIYDTINENLEKYTVDELIDEVTDNYPDLLGIEEEDQLPHPSEANGWN